jgi:hypothetical protein
MVTYSLPVTDRLYQWLNDDKLSTSDEMMTDSLPVIKWLTDSLPVMKWWQTLYQWWNDDILFASDEMMTYSLHVINYDRLSYSDKMNNRLSTSD